MEAIVIEAKDKADAKFWLNLAKKQEPKPVQQVPINLKMKNLSN